MKHHISKSLLQAAGERGISEQEITRQLKLFEKGVPPVRLAKPCTVGDGIIRVDSGDIKRLTKIYESALENLEVIKFVPASGAASRMFRDLESLLSNYDAIDDDTLNQNSPEAKFGKTFIENIRSFAFWDELGDRLEKAGFNAETLLERKKYRPLIEYTLTKKGLGYATLPKALILFHQNNGEARTSLEEHFHETAMYGKDTGGEMNLHFTVSPEFKKDVQHLIDSVKKEFAAGGISTEVELSFQEPATDTLAVDMDNKPFLDENENYLFRPGGHGALLHNLNQIHGDIVFIKNIDNVVPDLRKSDTAKWKKVLGGYLAQIRERVFSYLHQLDNNTADLKEITEYCRSQLNINPPADSHIEEKKAYFKKVLNRPMRICGMVKNEGEPGGGPFWVKEDSGTISLQIVESSQINMADASQVEIVQKSTHFNPVDIVCTLVDYEGNPFNLEEFSNPDTAFIAEKSSGGRKLKALERPGLWNGAMHNWLTLFVEVPIETFNPVKTVNDLLRPQRQAG